MIPSAHTEKRCSAPPENMLNMSRMVPCCWLNNVASAVGSIPGTGIWVQIRKTIKAPTTNSTRSRSSVSLPRLARFSPVLAVAVAT